MTGHSIPDPPRRGLGVRPRPRADRPRNPGQPVNPQVDRRADTAPQHEKNRQPGFDRDGEDKGHVCGSYLHGSGRKQEVGWAEWSESHQKRVETMMVGLAPLGPPYFLGPPCSLAATC